MEKEIDLLVIGSGPAGFTAGIYAARAGIKPLIAAGEQIGGLLTETSVIENFPGFPEPLPGYELMDRMQRQAENCGAEVLYDTVSVLDLQNRSAAGFKVCFAGGDVIYSRALIIATGAKHRELGLPEENSFRNKGLSYCATCDGPLYNGKVVTVIGGGNSALEEALYLATLAERVNIVHRRDEFRASNVLVQRVMAQKNIDIHWNSTAAAIYGDAKGRVAGVKLENMKDNKVYNVDCNGIFVSVGLLPNTKLLEGQLPLQDGYIPLPYPASTQTQLPGVFAAGDCVDRVYRQAITAAAMGCRAGIDAARWLSI